MSLSLSLFPPLPVLLVVLIWYFHLHPILYKNFHQCLSVLFWCTLQLPSMLAAQFCQPLPAHNKQKFISNAKDADAKFHASTARCKAKHSAILRSMLRWACRLVVWCAGGLLKYGALGVCNWSMKHRMGNCSLCRSGSEGGPVSWVLRDREGSEGTLIIELSEFNICGSEHHAL